MLSRPLQKERAPPGLVGRGRFGDDDFITGLTLLLESSYLVANGHRQVAIRDCDSLEPSTIQFVAHPRERSLSRITSVCSSGVHLVEADRTDSQSYCPTEDGSYPLPGYPHLGHPLLSVIPGLLRSFEPPSNAVALHTRRCPQSFVLPTDGRAERSYRL